MEMLVSLFIFVVFGGIIGFSLLHDYTNFQEMKDELYKIVQHSGATNIYIDSSWLTGANNPYHFVVTYIDANGREQERHVTRYKSSYGKTDEFLWNQPLTVWRDEHMNSRLSNKEQIISDMDAEIKRLRTQLRLSRSNS